MKKTFFYYILLTEEGDFMQKHFMPEVNTKNNFEMLKQYVIPADVLKEMLRTYQLIGRGDVYKDILEAKEEQLKKRAVELDAFLLADFLNLDLTENRKRLILTKDSTPRTKEEKILKNLKDVLLIIRKNAKIFTFNGSDILEYLNIIFGSGSHKFSAEKSSVSVRNPKNPVSNRLIFEKTLESYHEYFMKDTFEHLHLSVVAYLEMLQIKPFTKNNELASILVLYYMILRSNIDCFEYISFMSIFLKSYQKVIYEQNRASINYPTGYFQLNDIMRLLFALIKEGYDELLILVKEQKHEEHSFKSDSVEQIIKNLPTIFSKDEIKNLNPNTSISTINRVLVKLRDEGLIKPLGTGRSAKWMKTNISNDFSKMIGEEDED